MMAESGILITLITGPEYHPMSRSITGQSSLPGPDTGTARSTQVIAVIVA